MRVKLLKQLSIILVLIFLALASLLNTSALATDTVIHSSIEMRSAIVLTKDNDMEFGVVEYEPTHNGHIQLSTDNTASLSSGSSGLKLSGSSQSASVSVSGDAQSSVEISCEDQGILSDGNANNLTIRSIEYNIDSGTPFGSGTSCLGINNVSSQVDLSLFPAFTIYVGGEIDLSGNTITNDGIYNTSNAGGNPITLRVVYQ